MSGWLKRGGEKVKEKLKGGYEYFEAHNQVVTAAIFAPTRTRQAVARTGLDTIYNNTIIPTDSKSANDSVLARSTSNASNLTTQSDMEAEQARQQAYDYTYPNGHIIISADNVGVIKVWRVDCGTYANSRNTLSPTNTKQDHAVGSTVLLQPVRTTDSSATSTKTKRNLASIFGKHK